MKMVIVTGMSGAGKSSVLRLFEDMGYYCMDNIPPRLINNFLDLTRSASKPMTRVALGVDIRGGAFFEDLQSTVEALKKEKDMEVTTLFLTASDETLVRRYKELRRPHPMDKAGNIFDGIQREKNFLAHLRQTSDVLVDTTDKTLGELKEQIDHLFLPAGEKPALLISVISFGYKHGIVLDADLVFDVRFVNNPYYVADLRKLTGLDASLQDYVLQFPETTQFLTKALDLLSFLIPLYIREGKRTLTVALGCTGGRHRSVVMAEMLGQKLSERYQGVNVSHRDRRYWKESAQKGGLR
ncbi:RNase adapter RapZ [Murdochiella massiliensis]|uniref:RNase adapter RapZ n=1 Tax=Murdochiella massiliensis TaxID=1673723 RepID=UPI00082D2F25|nr:RNase adapter RapZ [Murdochiella massiliensis]MBY0585169.1 RNase adapter RapZ [Murdochiella sp. Marseille-P8839]